MKPGALLFGPIAVRAKYLAVDVESAGNDAATAENVRKFLAEQPPEKPESPDDAMSAVNTDTAPLPTRCMKVMN